MRASRLNSHAYHIRHWMARDLTVTRDDNYLTVLNRHTPHSAHKALDPHPVTSLYDELCARLYACRF